MPLPVVAYGTLAVFVIVLVLTLFRKINLPIQTVLILIALFNVAVAAVVRLGTEGRPGALLLGSELLSGVILHPITALLAGLFLAGALTASGGFDALKVIIQRLQRTPLGLAGALVILVNLPLVAALPCGRILGAALLPLLFAFGPEEMRVLGKVQVIVLVGAFARNAFGSCGPSPLGGVGQIGEGFLGAHFAAASTGILRAPQAFALLLGTAFMALFLKIITTKIYPHDSALREAGPAPAAKETPRAAAPARGYVALGIFGLALLVAIFQPFGKYAVQTVLVGACLVIMLSCRVKLTDLLAGILLMPVTAMAAGFLAAGSLALTGGFDALANVLKLLADVRFLGVAGMLAIFVQIQTIMPLSCSRILTAALVPTLYLFGPAGLGLITWPQLAIVMAAYMINATTSCAPSPLGGAGMMAEGTLRAETGYLKGAFSFAAMAVMAPLAALFMKFINLEIFASTEGFVQNLPALAVGAALVIGVNYVMVHLVGKLTGASPTRGWNAQLVVFLVTGALAGAMLAFALYDFAWLAAAQGAFGGLLAAAAIAVMTPRARNLAAA
jgi:hypothetical protein